MSGKKRVPEVPAVERRWLPIVLVMKVEPSNVKKVKRMLAVMRTGLAAPHLASDPQYAGDFDGPFLVDDERDIRLLEALGEWYEGIEDDEPIVIENRQFLKGVRAMAPESRP